MDDVKTPENADGFYCSYCEYKCSKKSDWERHTARSKHKTNAKRYENDDIKTPKNAEQHMTCHCGKLYKHYSGLWRHQNTCIKEKPTDKIVDNQNLLDFLIKQNSDLQKQILEVCKNGIVANNHINLVNSNNKTFNLQVFLNEECKDAMNIKDFVDSIQFQLADVESIGELGYVNGISRIIIRNLKALDANKRPVHCTDQKRETIYIKDAGVWVKDEDNSRMRKMIKTISNRGYKST